MDEKRFMYYFLSCIEGIGNAAVRKIKSLDPDISDLHSLAYCTGTDILEVRILTALKNGFENLDHYKRGYEKLRAEGICFTVPEDDEYPERLRNIQDPPEILYYRGELPENGIPAVAVVGSRAMTNYGRSVAAFIGEVLGNNKVNVISGMARGIDTSAHAGALRSEKGRTWCILANGVNICYPRENYGIYTAVADNNRGGIISEYPPGTKPLRFQFPVRNRIISGLSDAVVIVEAREKSGSLITVDFALEQGREVFAVPGRMTDPMSRGCNRLIESGCRILNSPEDILELFPGGTGIRGERKERDPDILDEQERKVYLALDMSPKYAEDISTETGIELNRLYALLLSLELKGYITQISGNYYGIM